MKSFDDILAFLAPFAPLLKTELLNLDATAKAELQAKIDQTTSPDLKLLFTTFLAAADSFAQAEIAKL